MINRILVLFIVLSFFSCRNKNQGGEYATTTTMEAVAMEADLMEAADTIQSGITITDEKLLKLVPSNYIVTEEIYGDLNKEGVEDCILIIKATEKENIIDHEWRGKLDRNRRGIIIAFKNGDYYETVVHNHSCFSSENEDGGVYFAPELSVEINQKGNLGIHYSHGRYGHWEYIFRYQNNTFELIGFASHSNRGPVGLSKTSINYSTGKRVDSTNLNQYCDECDEKWEDIWSDVENVELLKLGDIEDFDNLL